MSLLLKNIDKFCIRCGDNLIDFHCEKHCLNCGLVIDCTD